MNKEQRLQALLEQYESLKDRSAYEDLSDVEDASAVYIRMIEAVLNLAPAGSAYERLADSWLSQGVSVNRGRLYRGAVKALLDDFQAGVY